MRKHSPGEFHAIPADASTNPAPPSTIEGQVAELRGALEVVGELCGKLLRSLTETRIAQLVSEHKQNVTRAKRIADRRLLGDHERRVREVEKFLPLLAEIEKERGTAAE